MTNFTQTFSGAAITSTDIAYANYSFSSNLVLFWPQFSNGQTNVAARFMNMTATVSSLNVIMPDATLVSVGYDVLIVNIGSNTFNVVSLNGNAICTLTSGQAFYVNLTNNTTQDGAWQVIQFGVGTGAVVAAALAGAGLQASGNLLQQNILGATLAGNTTIASTARAVLQIWTGGSGTITLPLASSMGNGFFFPFANDGSGSVTVATTGSDTIDGMSTSVFAQSQSAFIVSSGASWYTVGKGLQNNFSVTVLNLNVAGSSDVTETSAQAQNIIQQYTGVLTAAINVIMPATPQIYFVFNNTTGAFTLTVKTAAGTGVQVAQGTNTILYCDGTNIISAFSSSFGSSITLPVGSAGAPTLNFQGSTSTGIYSPTTNQMAITAGGHEVMNFTAPATAVNFLQVAASSTGADVSISALGSDTNISWDLIPKNSGFIKVTNFWTNTANISGGNIDNTVIGGSTPLAITGTSITGTGQVKGNTVVSTSSITAGAAISSISTVTGTSLISTIATGTAPLTVTSTTPVTNLSIGGNAATVTTNANTTGDVTSVGNVTTVAAIAGVAVHTPTGSGNVVFSNTPTLVSPILGTPTSGNLVNCTGYPVSLLMTPLAVGSITMAYITAGGAVTQNTNYAAASLTGCNYASVTTTGGLSMEPSGDSLTGTWKALQSATTGGGNFAAALFQRIS